MKKQILFTRNKELKLAFPKSGWLVYMGFFFMLLIPNSKLFAQGDEMTLPEITVTASFEGELDESTMGDLTYSNSFDFASGEVNNDLSFIPQISWVTASQFGNAQNIYEVDFPTGQMKNLVENSGKKCIPPTKTMNSKGETVIVCGMSIENKSSSSLTVFDASKMTMDVKCIGCENKAVTGDGNIGIYMGTKSTGTVGYIFDGGGYDKFGKVTFDYEQNDNVLHAVINPVTASGTLSLGTTVDGIKTTLNLAGNTNGPDFGNLEKVTLSAEGLFDGGKSTAKIEVTYNPQQKDGNVDLGQVIGLQITIGGAPNSPTSPKTPDL